MLNLSGGFGPRQQTIDPGSSIISSDITAGKKQNGQSINNENNGISEFSTTIKNIVIDLFKSLNPGLAGAVINDVVKYIFGSQNESPRDKDQRAIAKNEERKADEIRIAAQVKNLYEDMEKTKETERQAMDRAEVVEISILDADDEFDDENCSTEYETEPPYSLDLDDDDPFVNLLNHQNDLSNDSKLDPSELMLFETLDNVSDDETVPDLVNSDVDDTVSPLAANEDVHDTTDGSLEYDWNQLRELLNKLIDTKLDHIRTFIRDNGVLANLDKAIELKEALIDQKRRINNHNNFNSYNVSIIPNIIDDIKRKCNNTNRFVEVDLSQREQLFGTKELEKLNVIAGDIAARDDDPGPGQIEIW